MRAADCSTCNSAMNSTFINRLAEPCDQLSCNFSLLPVELIEMILVEHIGMEWHLIIRSVCSQWNQIVTDRVHANGPCVSPGKTLCDIATSKGHLALFQWLTRDNYLWSENHYFYSAIENGHMEIIKYIIKRIDNDDNYDANFDYYDKIYGSDLIV